MRDVADTALATSMPEVAPHRQPLGIRGAGTRLPCCGLPRPSCASARGRRVELARIGQVQLYEFRKGPRERWDIEHTHRHDVAFPSPAAKASELDGVCPGPIQVITKDVVVLCVWNARHAGRAARDLVVKRIVALERPEGESNPLPSVSIPFADRSSSLRSDGSRRRVRCSKEWMSSRRHGRRATALQLRQRASTLDVTIAALPGPEENVLTAAPKSRSAPSCHAQRRRLPRRAHRGARRPPSPHHELRRANAD